MPNIQRRVGRHLGKWEHCAYNEFERSRRYATTNPAAANGTNAVTALDRHYGYDPIGNRVYSDEGFRPTPPDPNDPNDPNAGYPTQVGYVANALNQYTRAIELSPAAQLRFLHDADGPVASRRRRCHADGGTPQSACLQSTPPLKPAQIRSPTFTSCTRTISTCPKPPSAPILPPSTHRASRHARRPK